MNSRKCQSSSFDSLYISQTYFSAQLQAARGRPVIGLNHMSPGGDYSLKGKLEKSKFSYYDFVQKSAEVLKIVLVSRNCYEFQKMLVFEIGRDATQYSSSFESRISITYFSDLPPAARQRPVNQMSPRGDYHNVADMAVWGKILAKTHSFAMHWCIWSLLKCTANEKKNQRPVKNNHP